MGLTRDPCRFERFRFERFGQGWAWWLFALVLLLAPQVLDSHFGISMLSQMGIAILACLSYNFLFGQGGMLSFGHAVYTGLGSYAAIHALLRAADGGVMIPVSLIPLVGGLAGLLVAALFGWVMTRKAGTAFAMITLGFGELVFALALMFPDWFGGEAGISANRVVGEPFFGITWGPSVQVYYLIAVYTYVGVAAMFALTRTPLGRILNAVRDNPERVEFIGYDVRAVRYWAMMVAGFFAGVSGGLAAILFEIVTPEVLGSLRSGAYLLFTVLGGSTFFFGPILGGVLMVLALVFLSELTQAWMLYLGLIFVFMMMHAPGGLASVIMANLRVAAHGRWRELWGGYLALGGTGLAALAGASAMIEMLYHLQHEAALGPHVEVFGLLLDPRSAQHWIGAAWVLATGAALFELARRRLRAHWNEIQLDIEKETQRRERAA
ncbi:urea ABC transporter, permease protein UrtC [Tepidimonas alkaliphilus]|uniref:Urea ABC transporter, permease protein UrtC n=1 Tax=Tepidimonas alkaliphilus TaxID=2588942 RepID=A0A554WA68_9BURK|nr:branched-chain amino acid ABC transporter permease [Tepidimonas alkaliphilus]TSE20468.1 urea ABC transporter, permease protein UrtC [Tepidimonas alkaliphilus]